MNIENAFLALRIQTFEKLTKYLKIKKYEFSQKNQSFSHFWRENSNMEKCEFLYQKSNQNFCHFWRENSNMEKCEFLYQKSNQNFCHFWHFWRENSNASK